MENTELNQTTETETQTSAAAIAPADPFDGIIKNGDTYRGTVTQFIEAGIKLNGIKMDAVSLSALGRYKLIPQVGERKPARGRSAAVYEIKSGQGGFEL